MDDLSGQPSMKATTKLLVAGALALGVLAIHIVEDIGDSQSKHAVAPRAGKSNAAARVALDADDITPPSASAPPSEVAPWDVKPSDPAPPAHHIAAWQLRPPRPDVSELPPPPTEPVPATRDDATINGSRPPR
jgi:hypothetical protein